jgi:hypothetical protein
MQAFTGSQTKSCGFKKLRDGESDRLGPIGAPETDTTIVDSKVYGTRV